MVHCHVPQHASLVVRAPGGGVFRVFFTDGLAFAPVDRGGWSYVDSDGSWVLPSLATVNPGDEISISTRGNLALCVDYTSILPRNSPRRLLFVLGALVVPGAASGGATTVPSDTTIATIGNAIVGLGTNCNGALEHRATPVLLRRRESAS